MRPDSDCSGRSSLRADDGQHAANDELGRQLRRRCPPFGDDGGALR